MLDLFRDLASVLNDEATGALSGRHAVKAVDAGSTLLLRGSDATERNRCCAARLVLELCAGLGQLLNEALVAADQMSATKRADSNAGYGGRIFVMSGSSAFVKYACPLTSSPAAKTVEAAIMAAAAISKYFFICFIFYIC